MANFVENPNLRPYWTRSKPRKAGWYWVLADGDTDSVPAQFARIKGTRLWEVLHPYLHVWMSWSESGLQRWSAPIARPSHD